MRLLAFIGSALLVLALCGAAAAYYSYGLLEAPSREGSVQTFVVAPGEGLARVARNLELAGLVQDARVTRWYAQARGLAADLKAGEYDLSASLSTPAILEQLTRGTVKTYQVVLPEGIRATEIAQRIGAAGLAEASKIAALTGSAEFANSLGIDAQSLEGYLFPETYNFARGLPPEEIVRELVAQFKREWAVVEADAQAAGMSMHEVVTLASIVEKETAAPEERPLIAAVFRNRIDLGMRLETDPTVIYGIANFDGNLKRRHLDDTSNPYNTYRIPGLPPGPIASPGAEALRAVVNPADSDYLYFVSRNDGSHVFSVSYRDHTNAVNRYQRRRSSK